MHGVRYGGKRETVGMAAHTIVGVFGACGMYGSNWLVMLSCSIDTLYEKSLGKL